MRGCSKKEIIQIQVGKAGNKIGHEFWRDLCEEHRIEYANSELRAMCFGDPGDNRQDHLDVFFQEGLKGSGGKTRWVPRCILVDLNMHDLHSITRDALGDMYKPENIVCNDEGSGNCYAKAFHLEGPDIADQVLENVRKESEKCDCLQGVQFTHSVSGGTGSGLTGLLLKTLHDFLDKGSRCILQNFTLVPSPRDHDVLIEPYNAALGLQDLLEYSHQVFLYDNESLTGICQKVLEQETPHTKNLNDIVAMCMSGLTACLRFTGPLNSDLHKLQTNLVPFQNAHFLISGFAPLTALTSRKYRKTSVQDLALQMISKDNVTVRCDPLNPGDKKEGIDKARFLAAFASWRGKFKTQEVDMILHDVQKPNSRFDKFFPDWIPNVIASNICDVPHVQYGDSVTFIANSTSVNTVFDRIIKNWDALYKSKSYLRVYQQDGISTQDMLESRNVLQYIKDQYCEFGRWEDSFFETNMGAEGRPVVKDSAVDNSEQQEIAQELAELMPDGKMYISIVKDASGRRH